MLRLGECLRCVRHTPRGRAFWGYIFVKIIQALLTAWGGIVYAGVLTYEALRVTDCLPADDSSACRTDSGGGGSDDADDTPGCRRVWGLVTPESLLTVIATAGAVVIALSSAFVGNYMDSTPYRRQIAVAGVFSIGLFMFVCAAILYPSEDILILCSISLFLLTILKEVLSFTVETYAPELSAESSEVAAAITAGNLWFYSCMVLWLLVMTVAGVGLSSSMFGFVSTVLTACAVLAVAFCAFSRLPDVPAAHARPAGPGESLPLSLSLARASLLQLRALAAKTYLEYPDIGLVLLANMLFDPALNAIFVVAIQVLVSAYHFTSQEIPIIFLCAVIFSVPGIICSKLVTTSKLWEYFEDDEEDSTSPGTVASTQVVGNDIKSSKGKTAVSDAVDIELVDSSAGDVMIEEDFGNSLDMAEVMPGTVLRHPRRIVLSLCGGLAGVTLVTLAAPFILQPCNLGLAILVGCMWSFCMCYNWNCSTMLRAALVPGGSEAEFAGLAIVAFNVLSWLPLLIFLLMANTGYLIEAMWSLTAFFAAGFAVLCCVDAKRGAAARDKTMHLRRWVRNSGRAVGSAAGASSASVCASASVADVADASICDGNNSRSGTSGKGGDQIALTEGGCGREL
jgi:hypothetical protein